MKQLTNIKGAEVYVATGPLYLPRPTPDKQGWMMQHPMIGADIIAVGTCWSVKAWH